MRIKYKICAKCKQELSIQKGYFCKRKTSKDGLNYWCKDCRSENQRRYRKLNRKKRLEWDRNYRLVNKEKLKRRRDAYKNKKNARKREMRIENPKTRLNDSISAMIRFALKEQKNGRHWENLTGYTLEQLVSHLEKQFQPGMSWDNYGEWQIDHIIPISAFNFTRPECIDFKKCWALENLQPLWASENISKFNRLEQDFQPSLAI